MFKFYKIILFDIALLINSNKTINDPNTYTIPDITRKYWSMIIKINI